LLHVARSQRQVVLGREIDVVRKGKLEPALAGDSGRRRKKARFSLVVEREIELGRREHVDALEVHAPAARGAHVAGEIEIQLVRLDVPAVIAGLARGEDSVLDPVLVFAQNLYAFGLAARSHGSLVGPKARSEGEFRLLYGAGRILERVP